MYRSDHKHARQYINTFKWPSKQAGVSKAIGHCGRKYKEPSRPSPRSALETWQDDTIIEDDDVPLDAFDRELLAQANACGSSIGGNLDLPQLVRDETSLSASLTPISATKSPYFNRLADVSQNTPTWSKMSSSEAADLPSSPVMITSKGKGPVAHNPKQTFQKPVASVDLTSDPFFSPLQQRRGQSISNARSCKESPSATVFNQNFHGITLVPIHRLPDRLRPIFHFPVFNAMQSKTFDKIYNDDCNLVLSSPTGSGKTVIMELAICRLFTTSTNNQFKVIYQAPTKSLCSERLRDWKRKFSTLNLECAELTGDTDQSQLQYIQTANIIITTPEKWDSMTRKWKDHSKFIQLVKLFLIDEVHILKETRGATLEAVVSRMKSMDSNVRFVALSATVPNADDIATWLGRDSSSQHLPAHLEMFGEEFRPVKLQKFVYGHQSGCNDFAFDKLCDAKIPEIIATHSQQKPILIFCSTRKFAITTAKALAKAWKNTPNVKRLWMPNSQQVRVQDNDLSATLLAGVAFHHAGLSIQDRQSVENGFLKGDINIICCTSTLAVGMNLPCHLVIIKNTISWQDNGFRQYSDLEVIQMLGRAGRPQFDDSAIAVIITRKDRVSHYEKLVSGSEPLESCLHNNLIDHINAEIGLGAIYNIESAIKWLRSTFFFVRLRKNPKYYNLKEGANARDEESLLATICEKDIQQLQETKLVATQGRLKSTELGNIMARYYVKFKTMRLFLSLPHQANMKDIISILSGAEEFREIRLKAGEKSLYKEINKDPAIIYPINIDIGLPSHKISLLIQAELGAVEIPTDEPFQKHKLTFQQDKILVFAHANRLIRCIVDCSICLGDAVTARHALQLARSIGAKVWDGSPLQMKQIEGVGLMTVRKLASGGITTIEALELADAHRIDMLLSKNPPFGSKLLAKLATFPKLWVELSITKKDIRKGCMPKVFFKATVGFLNQKPVLYFHRKPINLCFLAESSDGRLIDFRRMSAAKLGREQDINFGTELVEYTESISCHIMCEEIAGTSRKAEVALNLPKSCFPPREAQNQVRVATTSLMKKDPQHKNAKGTLRDCVIQSDDFLDDEEFLAAVEDNELTAPDTSHLSTSKSPARILDDKVSKRERSQDHLTDVRRDINGKYQCNHRCKDKSRHFCCREGLDQPPKSGRSHMQGQQTTDSPRGRKAYRQLSSASFQQAPKKVKRELQHIDLTKDRDYFGDDAEMDLMFQSISPEIKNAGFTQQDNRSCIDANEDLSEGDSPPSNAEVGVTSGEVCANAQSSIQGSQPAMTDVSATASYTLTEASASDVTVERMKSTAVPSKWEGIDPEIYEEFGDLVEIV